MKIIKFTALFFILIFFIIVIFCKKVNFETNLVKTLLPENVQNVSDIILISNKSLLITKVIFEGNDISKLKEKFLKKMNNDFFEVNEFDFSNIFSEYKKSNSNFLSDDDRDLLKNKKYDILYKNALEQLYNPISIQIIPFEKDPYFLFTDFLLSNKPEKKQYDNLTAIELRVKDTNKNPIELINKEIEKLIKLQSELSSENSKIYLAGTPIHSYYTSKNAKTAINIITILSLLLILAVTYYYFKNIKIIIPVILSIGFGILSGFCAVKLFFQDFQVITMVFSTSIIGLGIDYSYHYFFHQEINKNFIKNLTISILTTIVPFILFYLTGIELLKQIAVFSIFALISIYCFVLLYYSYFKIPKPEKNIRINYNVSKAVLCLLIILSVTGYSKLKFNDSLSAFYVPSKKLLKAEQLYKKSENKENIQTQIITVKGKNIEEILEKENIIAEKLKEEKIEYISLSKIFPSVKTQKENIKLVKELYRNNLDNFKNILSDKQINNLKNQKYQIINAPAIKEFFLNENTSMMFVFTQKDLKIDEKGMKIINIKTDTENYLKEYRYKIIKYIPLLFLSVFIFLWIFYGIKKGFKIFLPSIAGIFSCIGLASLIYSEINLFSIISMFLVLGFTIDYSVFQSENKQNSNNAVFVSALTTSFSFLLLSLTSFKLLSSIALILFFGIIVSYLTCNIIYRKDE